MAITKAENKSMNEERMPAGVPEQRKKICAITGHLFPANIRAMLKKPEAFADKLPKHALCSRCGQKITLKQ